ncbi:hypothetical protein [Enhygromyxa salina]|nr:hypothetical protein [Enhygromyxa salina]
MEARQAALLTALHRMSPRLTLARLDLLLRDCYGEALAKITVTQLGEATPRASIWRGPNQSLEDAVMQVFRARPNEAFSSGFFIRHTGLRRRTAQSLLADLADRGWLEREGKTSGTRYRLAARLIASRAIAQ